MQFALYWKVAFPKVFNMDKITVGIVIMLIVLSCNRDSSKNYDSYPEKDLFQESSRQNELYKELKVLDSLFFSVAYNQCDSITGRKLISKDFEFYHDQGGFLLDSADVLAADIIVEDFSWTCEGTFRKPVYESFKVYPLHDGEQLYGAIQVGEHEFYDKEGEQPTALRTRARFIHLWMIENDAWKLRRVLSFDHQKVQNTE